MSYFKKISGKNIYLSPKDPADAEKYVSWLCDSAVSDGIGSTARMLSVDAEKKWISDTDSNYNFAIVVKDPVNGDRLIGNCGFNLINQIRQYGEIGIFIGSKENRGKGYGTEAVNLLLEYGFQTLNLHSISLNYFSFNKQAEACYKKCGFKPAGCRREAYFCSGKFYDELTMDILADEYRAARNN